MDSEGSTSELSEDLLTSFRTRLITDFSTPHYVVIKSKWLRIPELCLNCFLLLAFIGYIVVPLNFMREASLIETSTLELRAPLQDWWNSDCTYIKDDCETVAPNKTACKVEGLPSGFKDCLVPVTDTISPKSQAIRRNDIHIAFSVFREVEQCGATDLFCDEQSSLERFTQEKYAFAGIDTFMLFFRHRFESAGWSQAAAEVQGLIHFLGREQPCRFQNKMDTATVVKDESFFKRVYPDMCGTANGNGTDTGMTTTQGDYISIGLLLKAANMSVDSIRRHGGAMTLEIVFTNMDVTDFWSWPWGPKSKYTLSPREQVYGSTSSQDIFFTETEEINATARWHVVKPCLRLALNFRGVHGVFDWIILLTRLTVCSAAFTFAHFFINNVLVFLYQWTGLKHVYALHTISVQQETKRDDEFYNEFYEGDSLAGDGCSPKTLSAFPDARAVAMRPLAEGAQAAQQP